MEPRAWTDGMEETRAFYERCADLYDLASWDVEDEADFLAERLRLGPARRRVLEVACGAGRLLEPLARRGFAMEGLDCSDGMLARSRARIRASLAAHQGSEPGREPELELDAHFGAAFCAVSSLGYLGDVRAAANHLECLARHLEPGSPYLVQLEIESQEHEPTRVSEFNSWERPTPRGTLRTTWYGRDWDPQRRIETQVSRFEFMDGPEAGHPVEDLHRMRIWSYEEWAALIRASPFRLVAAWDGSRPDRRELPLDASLERHTLIWHELLLA